MMGGGGAGFFAGSLYYATRYTPHRRLRASFAGSLAGITAMMLHLSFVEPACFPHNRDLGR